MSRPKGLGTVKRLTREELIAYPHIRKVYGDLSRRWGLAVGERYLMVMAKPSRQGGNVDRVDTALKQGVEA